VVAPEPDRVRAVAGRYRGSPASNLSTWLVRLREAYPFLDEADCEDARSCLQLVTVPKGSRFLEPGETPARFGIVLRGLFRFHACDADGNECTKYLAAEHHLLASYAAMIRQRPSWYGIEALEPSTVVTFDHEGFRALQHRRPGWLRFGADLLERLHVYMEDREASLLLLDGTARYRAFLRESPGLDTRVPQHVLASYLHLAPETLSRIRRRLRTESAKPR